MPAGDHLTTEQERERQIIAVREIFRELGRMTAVLQRVDPPDRWLRGQMVDGDFSDEALLGCLRTLPADCQSTLDLLLCGGILHLLVKLTEPQRLVWWHSDRILERGEDPSRIAVDARGGVVTTAGLATSEIVVWGSDNTVIFAWKLG